mgnify:CR=1 FL=1
MARTSRPHPPVWRWSLLFLPLLLVAACGTAGSPAPVSTPESLSPADAMSTAAVTDPADAERILRIALDANPDQPELLAQLGSVLLRKDKAEEAAESLQRAVELGNVTPDGRLNPRAARYQQGDIDGAIEVFEQARAGAPDDPDLLYNLGSAYAQRGDNDQALALYQEAIAADPNQSLAWYGLGTIYHNLQERDAAIDALTQFLSLSDEPELRTRAEQMIAELQATP